MIWQWEYNWCFWYTGFCFWHFVYW